MPAKLLRPPSRVPRASAGNGHAGAITLPPIETRGRVRCSIREGPPRQFAPDVAGERMRLIVMNHDKWVNGTVLRYAFFSGNQFASWAGTDALRQQVRRAFQRWQELGIGLRFEEAPNRSQSQIRIGFLPNDGHWSYVGRQILDQGADDRTLNLDPTDGIDSGAYGVDVACHEIGHTMGFPHEHQNPNAGIVWNEEAVYRALEGPPNFWSRDKTYHNIIRKIPPDQVQGSSWDPESVMHYPFGPGLILEPSQFRTSGIQPPGGLSARDKQWVKTFYPALGAKDHQELALLATKRLTLGPGEQRNFVLKPAATRYYELRTFGRSDTVMVLFERDANKRSVYLTGDDDSGQDRNAYIRRRLHAGREYVMRLRLYYAADAGETGVMWW
jgi:hypothetical protein